ncbi:MAG: efflux transporter outer membrane subunit [Sterolibacterium sp.]|nr:efflux transporter outer membrane subunit [Sterolibacterium sp.]MBP9800775.1 efflux transporter outer membrane subunit [Sterolibacterium sp.]
MSKPFHHAAPAVLLLALTLSGCASGLDYQRPTPTLPQHWLATEAAMVNDAAVSSASALPDWRHYFTEPRLQALIGQALEHNRDLHIATMRIAEARAQYGIVHASKLPELELLGKREAGLTPGNLNQTGRPLSGQRYDVGVELLNYEIDFWGRVRRLDEAALASYLATEAAQRAFRLALMADVATAYYNQCELQERVALARAIDQNRREVEKLSAQRREAGLVGSMEYLRAAAAAEGARHDLAALEQASAAADHWLTLLTGTLSVSQATSGAPLPPAPSLASQHLPVLTADLPAEVLLNRPDVLAAEQHLVAANAQIGAARAAFLPRLSLTGVLGTASAGLSGLFDAGSRAWLFKPQLRLPLFNNGRDEANVDLAEARKNAAVADYEKTIQQAFREVADLLVARQKLAEQLAAQETGRRIQAERVALLEARYKAQISHWLEVLDARRDLQLADQVVLQLQRAQLANAAQLYKALGGGGEAGMPAAAVAGQNAKASLEGG